MKRIKPTWLNMRSGPSDAGGKSSAIVLGQSAPRHDGPSRMPANTSAMTEGWPKRWSALASSREHATMTPICTNSSVGEARS